LRIADAIPLLARPCGQKGDGNVASSCQRGRRVIILLQSLDEFLQGFANVVRGPVQLGNPRFRLGDESPPSLFSRLVGHELDSEVMRLDIKSEHWSLL
jgi:hypothetical protein